MPPSLTVPRNPRKKKKPPKPGISPSLVARLLGGRKKGYNYHTILYWVREGIAQASIQYTGKHWAPVLFSVADAVEIAVIRALRKKKVPLEIIHKALEIIRSEGGQRLGSSLCLCVAGGDVKVVVGNDITHAATANGSSHFVNVGHFRVEIEAEARRRNIKLPGKE